jgi:hypothetical protein
MIEFAPIDRESNEHHPSPLAVDKPRLIHTLQQHLSFADRMRFCSIRHRPADVTRN